MRKRKPLIVAAVFIVLILIGLLGYFLNSKFHILADIIEGPYVIFQKDNFTQVTWDTEPATNEILKEGDTISTFAAQGQTEDVSFSVRPNQDLGEVQLDISDLMMGDKVIPKENIEVLNLKVWDQCAPASANPNGNWIVNCKNTAYTGAIYETTHKMLPELLVKNNEQDLVAAETAWGSAPQVDQNFKAILKLGLTHTFYLRITVPENSVSGDYTANISFIPSGEISGQTVKLALEVLPFVLPQSDKEISTHVGYRIDDAFFQGGRQKIGEENYGKYLDFLKRSGFNALVVNDYNNIDKVAAMMKARDFKRIIWRGIQYPTTQWTNPTVADEIKSKINQIKAAGFEEVYLYGYDEPNGGNTLVHNMEFAKFVHESGAKLATSITKQVADLSNTNSGDLPLRNSVGLSSGESKTDLPIYAAGMGKTNLFSDFVGLYFDRSWSFPLLNDVPAFQVFPRGETVNHLFGQYIKYQTPAATKYETALTKDTWHHVAGVFDGASSQYRLYIDNETSADFGFKYPDFDKGPNYNPIVSPFGNKIPKNVNRTYIGAAIDATRPLSTGKGRDGIVGFKGSLSGVKIYNKALTKEEIDSGSVSPKANYDFSGGELVDQTGSYPACQIVLNDGGQLEFRDDSPVAGKKSLFFSGNRYGPDAVGTPNSPHLDCGKIEDNYGIDDSMTVEFWIKLPNDTPVSNINGSVISRLEANDRNQIKLEDYIIGLRKKTMAKNDQTEFFYSQIWPEHGNLADRRGVSGFYLQSSYLDGYSPYGLDSPYNSEGAKYYDDFDANEKTEFAVLPSASGDPVLTYQFEAFRTGVDDSRYMTLYNDLLAQVKTTDSSKASEIDEPIQLMLDQYPYNLNGDNKSFVGQPNSYHQANRKLVADKIVEMQSILSPHPAPDPSKPTYIEQVNVSEGQKIKNNPYTLSVQVKDPATVSKVEYYVDDILIGTTTLPSMNKVFDCTWDTSKYHSVVKIIVYGTDGSTEEITRNTTVALGDNPPASDTNIVVLPKTGGSNIVTWLGNFLTAVIDEVKTAF